MRLVIKKCLLNERMCLFVRIFIKDIAFNVLLQEKIKLYIISFFLRKEILPSSASYLLIYITTTKFCISPCNLFLVHFHTSLHQGNNFLKINQINVSILEIHLSVSVL